MFVNYLNLQIYNKTTRNKAYEKYDYEQINLFALIMKKSNGPIRFVCAALRYESICTLVERKSVREDELVAMP